MANVNHPEFARLEILDWRDDILQDQTPDANRVIIEGLVPLPLAQEFARLCADHNLELVPVAAKP